MVSGISRPTSRKSTAESRGASRDEHIHHSCRWTRYNQQRNIGTSTPEALSPLFTHRAYATRRARLGERTRHGVRGLGKGKSPGCFIWRPLSAICSSNQGCMNSPGVPESIGYLSHNSAKEKRDMKKSDEMK